MKKLNIYKTQNYMLNDAFDQTVMNIHIQRERHGFKSFTICGCEPGDGTTTVAINLAAALASAGWKTVLVDGDMRKKGGYKRLNEDAKMGLSNYLMEHEDINEIIYETMTDMLYYIPCGDLISNPVRLLCSTQMEEVQKVLSENFDYVIYDMPALSAAMDANVVAVKTDACILVDSMGETSKKALQRAVNTLDSEGANLIGVVINKVDVDEYKRHNKAFDYFKKERYANTAKKVMKSKQKKN